MSAAALRRHIVVSGRVQGVGFRYATQREASRLGLRGWVRNTDDGKVEIVVEGDLAAVDALQAWCQRGPSGARVTNVVASNVSAREELGSFTIAR
jgi:acylphosphatase